MTSLLPSTCKVITRIKPSVAQWQINFTQQQRRHAQVLQTHRFLQTLSGSDKVLEKYREKLEQKMKRQGAETELRVSTYNELRQVYQEKIEQIRKQDATAPSIPSRLWEGGWTRSGETLATTRAATTTTTSHMNAFNPPSPPPLQGVKTLSSFIDVPKLLRHDSPQEIEFIWRARHIHDPKSLCAVIPKDTYLRIEANARKHPMFVLPLPRSAGGEGQETGSGVEMHFLQWTFPNKDSTTVLFTSLAAYKLHGEFALPHTTVTHHLEIMHEKGLVLLQGAVVSDKGVSAQEAKLLLMALQKFYAASGSEGEGEGGLVGERRLELLEKFTRGDETFRIEDVIDEVERV